MAGNKFLFTASWVILLVLFVALAALSLNSLRLAYTGAQDALTPSFALSDLQAVAGEAAATAFRGRRATAATWAFGFALLALIITLVPYRRGERWAWWALLVSIGLSQLLSLARFLALHSTFGTGAPGVILAFALLGLMVGAPRMFSKRSERG